MVSQILSKRIKHWDRALIIVSVALPAIAYLLLVHPSLQDLLDRQAVLDEEQRLLSSIAELRRAYVGTFEDIRHKQDELERQAVSVDPIGEVDEVLARLNTLGSQCGVEINSWRPIGRTEHEQYETELYIVEGESAFIDLHRWFVLIETGLPLLDVSHFSLQANQRSNENKCTFECTFKLHSGKIDPESTLVSLES
jgi:hypothetical protein